ncbi:hypothetical protein KOR34_47480 [Posidoniimonas corsicana]|uniref:Thioredoxin n=1 Tax=Posidoniimonas corsicana TaxID=1938618 RepID=A0A5C5UX75_9BACT|nr:thioredoxin family protein [Posidoniimonas corsicana]TWT30190.1 hypothetical protein KOR34_47480 [Posidoniimonas corsicana]
MNWHVLAVVVALAVAGPPLAEQLGSRFRHATPERCAAPSDLPVVVYSAAADHRHRDVELLHFWRPNCPVSVKTQARVRALQAQGYPIRTINTLRQRELSSRYQINATPTFITLEDGVVVGRVAAGLGKEQIAALIEG